MNIFNIFKNHSDLFRPNQFISICFGIWGIIFTIGTSYFRTNYFFIFVLITLTLNLIAFSFLYDYYYKKIEFIKSKNKKKTESYTSQIEHLNTSLKSSAGVILHRYGEFYHIYRYIRFQDALRNFVKKNSIVDTAQIYNYSVRNYDNQSKIKVFFDSGYAYEGIETNIIFQSYYPIQEDTYDKILNEIVPLWRAIYNSTFQTLPLSQRKAIEDTLLFLVEPLLKSLHEELRSSCINAQKKSDLKETPGIYAKYRLLTVLVRFLKGKKQFISDSYLLTDMLLPKSPVKKLSLGSGKKTLRIKEPISDEDIEKKRLEIKIMNYEKNLNHGKRTGLLGSILLTDIYIFRHTGDSSKNGRVYVSSYVEISKKDYIFLFTISEKGFDRIGEDIPRIITNLVTDFAEILKRSS